MKLLLLSRTIKVVPLWGGPVDSLEERIRLAVEVSEMSDEAAQQEIRRYEKFIHDACRRGEMSQEDVWDAFFGLLHECDERGLREDRRRIVQHIDTTRYNPFLSKHPEVRFLAYLRSRALGLVPAERN